MEDYISKYGFTKKTIQQENDEQINFYIKGNEESQKPKPLFLYIIGSGPCSIFMKNNKQIGSSIIFNFKEITEKYQLVVLTKPYIPFYIGDNFQVPQKYYETDSLDYQAKCNSLVIDFLIDNKLIDSSKIVVCGVSHGSDVASQIALINKNVTHLACIAGNGLLQTYNFINDVRKEYRNGNMSESEAEKQTQYLFTKFQKIYANPTSMKKWWGHTYKYWFSFFKESTLNRLLKLKIPIFFAKGTEDRSGCIEGTDIIPIEFIRHNKDNLTYKSYWGVNHMFQKNEEKQVESKHKTVTSDFWNWLENNRNR